MCIGNTEVKKKQSKLIFYSFNIIFRIKTFFQRRKKTEEKNKRKCFTSKSLSDEIIEMVQDVTWFDSNVNEN